MQLIDYKRKLRKEYKDLRDNISLKLKGLQEDLVVKKFIENCSHFKSYGIYYPLNSEFNMIKLRDELVKLNKTIALPCINGKDMYFKNWGNELLSGQFSCEPLQSEPIVYPEVIIVPLLAFDKSGQRLGYGKGFYDKFFISHPECFKVAMAFDFQEVDNLSNELHDVKMDMIITASQVIKI